jgi:hypothetical protein
MFVDFLGQTYPLFYITVNMFLFPFKLLQILSQFHYLFITKKITFPQTRILVDPHKLKKIPL